MNKSLSILAIAATLIISSCKGPDGDTGPIGPKGDTGAAGANGTNGKDGSTGAVGAAGTAGTNGKDGKDGVILATATPWTKVNFDEGKVGTNYSDKNTAGTDYRTTFSLLLKDTSQPLLTKEIMDNGIILTYYKYQSLLYNQDDRIYYLAERINGGASNGQSYANNFFKIDGRSGEKYEDFASIQLTSYEYAVNYWNPQLYLTTPYLFNFSNNQNTSTSYSPELVGKTVAFYKDLLKKHSPEIRLVIIPIKSGGRKLAIDYSDYNAVKKAYNLKD